MNHYIQKYNKQTKHKTELEVVKAQIAYNGVIYKHIKAAKVWTERKHS